MLTSGVMFSGRLVKVWGIQGGQMGSGSPTRLLCFSVNSVNGALCRCTGHCLVWLEAMIGGKGRAWVPVAP